MLRILKVTPVSPFVVKVQLTDRTHRKIDLRPYMRGPMFRPLLEDYDLFKTVEVVHGTLSWPTGQDLDPDNLLGTDIARRVVARWIEAMAAICAFDGISVYVYPADHPPSHIHVFHGSKEAMVEILSGKLLKGNLAPATRKKVLAWLKDHRSEVLEAFARAQAGQSPGKIPPP
jgi:hypothetical protein